jgi:hypothetical protein
LGDGPRHDPFGGIAASYRIEWPSLNADTCPVTDSAYLTLSLFGHSLTVSLAHQREDTEEPTEEGHDEAAPSEQAQEGQGAVVDVTAAPDLADTPEHTTMGFAAPVATT